MNNSWIARVKNWMNTFLRPYNPKDFKNHTYITRQSILLLLAIPSTVNYLVLNVIHYSLFIILIFWFQRTRSYFCDRRGNVICQSGWEKSQENENPLHPCSVPICRDGCNNGECKAPNYCTCDIGWTGLDCSTCLEKPGCQHGSCNEAFECNCDPEWFGSHCQTRKHNYTFL